MLVRGGGGETDVITHREQTAVLSTLHCTASVLQWLDQILDLLGPCILKFVSVIILEFFYACTCVFFQLVFHSFFFVCCVFFLVGGEAGTAVIRWPSLALIELYTIFCHLP